MGSPSRRTDLPVWVHVAVYTQAEGTAPGYVDWAPHNQPNEFGEKYQRMKAQAGDTDYVSVKYIHVPDTLPEDQIKTYLEGLLNP